MVLGSGVTVPDPVAETLREKRVWEKVWWVQPALSQLLSAYKASQAALKRMLDRREFEFYSGARESSILCSFPKHIVSLNLYGQNFTSKAGVAEPTLPQGPPASNYWPKSSLLSVTVSPIQQCTCALFHFGSRGVGLSSLSLILPPPQCCLPIILSTSLV